MLIIQSMNSCVFSQLIACDSQFIKAIYIRKLIKNQRKSLIIVQVKQMASNQQSQRSFSASNFSSKKSTMTNTNTNVNLSNLINKSLAKNKMKKHSDSVYQPNFSTTTANNHSISITNRPLSQVSSYNNNNKRNQQINMDVKVSSQNVQRNDDDDEQKTTKSIKTHYRSTSAIKKIFNDQTQYSYKPQIHHLPSNLYPQNREQIQISKQCLYQRLIDNLKDKKSYFQLLKLQKEQEQFKENCTFKPIINQVSKKIAKEKLRTQGNNQNQNQKQKYQSQEQRKYHSKNSLFERLYTQGLEKIQNQNQNSLILLNQQTYLTNSLGNVNNDGSIQNNNNNFNNECTFQPQINPVSKKLLTNEKRNLQPIYKRLDKIMQQKRLAQKLQKQYKQNQLKQQTEWKINNQITEEILSKQQKQGKRDKNVVKRLLNDYYKQKYEKQEQIQKQQNQKYESMCPFKPTLFSNLSLLNNGNNSQQQQQSFLQRQKNHQQMTKQNIHKKANEIIPKFKPQINKISQLLTKGRKYQPLEDKLNRLNYESYFNKQEKYDQLQASVYKQYTFQPQINEISKALEDIQPKSHSCNCHKKPQSYDFKPKINQNSRKMVQSSNKIKKQLPPKNSNKENLINQIRMEKQYKDLVQCTFKPQTKQFNKNILKQNNLKDCVPGIREYLEKSQIIKRKKIEDEKYQQKIFNLQKRYKPKTNTKIEQFKLTKPADIKTKLFFENEEKLKKQCPFTPNVKIR